MNLVNSVLRMKSQSTMALKRNAPALLTALGVSGTISTAYLTAKASFEAARVIDDLPNEDPTQREKVEAVWPLYIRPVITGTVTVTCIVAANHISSKRAAAAYSFLSVTEKTFDEYREKVKDLIGEGKEEKIRDEVAQDRINQNPPSENQVLIAGTGNTLCMEAHTGRYFHSDFETLRRSQNDVNAKLLGDMYVTLNDFYYMVDLESTTDSGLHGWEAGQQLELEISAAIYKGEPCLVVTYNYLSRL